PRASRAVAWRAPHVAGGGTREGRPAALQSRHGRTDARPPRRRPPPDAPARFERWQAIATGLSMDVLVERRRVALEHARALDLYGRPAVLLPQRLLAASPAFERQALLDRTYHAGQPAWQPSPVPRRSRRARRDQRTPHPRHRDSHRRPSA